MMRIQYWKDSLDRIYEASVTLHLLLSRCFFVVGQGYVLVLSVAKQAVAETFGDSCVSA